MIYWFTGQPSAGKTTLCKEIIQNNTDKSINIDGDDIRDIFNNKDYSETGRRKNVELAQNIALFLQNKGYDVYVSLVSPYRDQREEFKKRLGSSIVEIYVHSNEDRGRSSYFVSDYEKPLENFIEIDTTNKELYDTVDEVMYKIIKYFNKI